jgi:hypothetical protein
VVYNRDFFLEVPSMQEILYLTERQDYPRARSPRCRTCGKKRVLKEVISDPNNWILTISWTGTGNNRNPSLQTIPRFINFGGIDFKIGYVSYNQTVPGMPGMSHEVSIQDIRGRWYLYDGLMDPKFHRFDQEYYTENSARMTSMVYFKQDKED